MAWLSRVNFVSSDTLSFTDINNLGNDIRAWGDNVNGGGYTLSNVVLSASSGTMATVTGGTGAASTLTIRSTSGTGTSDAIVFQTASQSERMRITTSGNVGIGTPSPDALLTVNTIASFGDGAVTTPSIAHKGDLNTGFWFPAADTIAASTGGGERMRITSGGRVAINTTDPKEVLSVAGGYSAIGQTNPDNATNEKHWRMLVHTVNRSWMLQTVNDAYNAAATPIEVVRNSANYTIEKILLVQDGGNVGIGTSSPATSAKLEIAGTTGALLVPRLTTTERNALTAVNGMIIYNTTDNQMQGRINGAWVAM